jgi:hypothetical protein
MTQGIFSHETRTLEFYRGRTDPVERRPKPRFRGGKVSGHRHDESEAVLGQYDHLL